MYLNTQKCPICADGHYDSCIDLVDHLDVCPKFLKKFECGTYGLEHKNCNVCAESETDILRREIEELKARLRETDVNAFDANDMSM